MSTEKLHVRIGLSGTYWDRRPEYSMLINDAKFISHQKIGADADVVEYVEFDVELTEGVEYKLHIRLENKTNRDTVQNADKTAILQDMMLNIVSVELDEIDLSSLVHTHSQFIGDDESRPALDNCVNLGWNGTWTLAFTSPFYIWLLENI